jgi:hypothetical protein
MSPNVTIASDPKVIEPYKAGAFDAYISYCALGGILTDEDGEIHRMPLADFCATYGVTRKTLNRWKATPDWRERVDKRRDEVVPLARVTAVWNNMYLIARQSRDKKAAVEAARLFLGHNGLKLPVQRNEVEHQLGNTWADLLKQKRERTIVEAEVVDGTDQSG